MLNSNHPFELKVQTVVDEVISKIPNLDLKKSIGNVDTPDGKNLPVNQAFSKEDFLWERLNELGVEKGNTDSYSIIEEGYCKEGDARAVFCESTSISDTKIKIPIPWFRKLWSILSPSTSYMNTSDIHVTPENVEYQGLQSVVDAIRPVAQMKDKELLEKYDSDASDQVIEELRKRARNQAVFVFNKDKTFNVDQTLNMLRMSRRQGAPTALVLDGVRYDLRKAGDFPNDVYEESPLVPGNILNHGYCDKSELDFSKVTTEARQFLRLMYQAGHVTKDRISLLGLLKLAEAGVEELAVNFPGVASDFDRLKSLQQLPSLITDISGGKSSKKKSDPFGNGNKRF